MRKCFKSNRNIESLSWEIHLHDIAGTEGSAWHPAACFFDSCIGYVNATDRTKGNQPFGKPAVTAA